jgi:DNA repair ATPase RecN
MRKKIEELASMISGEEITEESIEYAKTLLS